MSAVPENVGLLLIPRDAEGPVFNEPWEAQAFALAVRLADVGCFSWNEWSSCLAQEIKKAQEQGESDTGGRYYQHWLNALERLCMEKNLLKGASLQQRKEEWRQAYLNTPHGKPIELTNERRQSV
jgi:nitrile hydratase accessory protein